MVLVKNWVIATVVHKHPRAGDVNECMYVVVDTEYHHHVLSGDGLWLCLWLTFKMLGFWFIS